MQAIRSDPFLILQFGEGGFIRAFADWMLDIANEKGALSAEVTLVKPRAGKLPDAYREQDCVWNVLLRGLSADERAEPTQLLRPIHIVKEALSAYEEDERLQALALDPRLRVILSNTTEAGLSLDPEDHITDAPPRSYPAKLTRLLYLRWKRFGDAPGKEILVLPLELNDENGTLLRNLVLTLCGRWGLEAAFTAWIRERCCFANTLVDRIVSGYPADAESFCAANGLRDKLLVAAEPYALWVIEAPLWAQELLPLPRAGLPVVFTDDIKPYKTRKVRILNGAHTSFVPMAYLLGHDIVREALTDDAVLRFVQAALSQEILPTLPFPREELERFAADVLTRFQNPYIDHKLLSICLNSVSKWKTRCLPTLLAFADDRGGALPRRLTFSLAALLAFYTTGQAKDGALTGRRGAEDYPLAEEDAVLAFFTAHLNDDPAALTRAFLHIGCFLGDPSALPDALEAAVAADLEAIRSFGMRQALSALTEGVK